MSLTLLQDSQAAPLCLVGSFTYESHSAFRQATQRLLEQPGVQDLVLDLSGLTYIDSSSLGMLLVLREKAEPKDIRVILRHPSPGVLTILRVVRFGQIFEIQED